jgi:hypothetical protein
MPVKKPKPLPRRIVNAAEKYASSIVDLEVYERIAQAMPDRGKAGKITMLARAMYQQHFDAFIEGARAGLKKK